MSPKQDRLCFAQPSMEIFTNLRVTVQGDHGFPKDKAAIDPALAAVFPSAWALCQACFNRRGRIQHQIVTKAWTDQLHAQRHTINRLGCWH